MASIMVGSPTRRASFHQDPPPRSTTAPAPEIRAPPRRQAMEKRGRSGSVLSVVKEASPDAAVLIEMRNLLGGDAIKRKLFNWQDYYPLIDWNNIDTVLDDKGMDRVRAIRFSGLEITSNFNVWGRTLDLLPFLEEVDISENSRLAGSINGVMLPKVVRLNMTNTSVGGTTKDISARLPMVQYLYADNSQITGAIAHLGKLVADFKEVSIRNTSVTGNFNTLQKLAPQWRLVCISGTQVAGDLRDVVSIAPNAKVLDLSRTGIRTDSLCGVAHKCVHLEVLDLTLTPSTVAQEDKDAFLQMCPGVHDLKCAVRVPSPVTLADSGAEEAGAATMCIDGIDEADWERAQERLRFFTRKAEIQAQKGCLLDLLGAGKTAGVGVSDATMDIEHAEPPPIPEVQPMYLSTQLQLESPSDPLDALLLRLSLFSRYNHRLRADPRSCDFETLLTLTSEEVIMLARDMHMKHAEMLRFTEGVQQAAYNMVAQECDKRYNKLVACVIGNSTYERHPLPETPLNDVAAFVDLLGRLGYETVVQATDCDAGTLRATVEEQLLPAVEPECMVLFYFAGHGIQLAAGEEGEPPANFLVGTANDVTDVAALRDASFPVDDLVQMIQERLQGRGSCCLLLDTCSAGPHVQLSDGKRGLAVPDTAPPGFALMYSASTGLLEAEACQGQTSAFCSKFVQCCNESVGRTPTSIVKVMSKVAQLMGTDHLTKGLPPSLVQAYEEARLRRESGKAWTASRGIKGKVGKKVNWHTRVALEQFDGVETDDTRLVQTLDLTNSYLRMDLAKITPILTDSLTTLILSRNPGVQGDIVLLQNCPSLVVVDAGHTKLMGDISVFQNCPNLRELVMPETKVGGDIQTLSGLAGLVKLDLRVCRDVCGSVFFLKPCQALEEVNLRCTGVTGSVDVFRYMRELTKLSLSNTGVGGSVEGLLYCRRLKDVDLRTTQVTGSKDDFARRVPCFTTM